MQEWKGIHCTVHSSFMKNTNTIIMMSTNTNLNKNVSYNHFEDVGRESMYEYGSEETKPQPLLFIVESHSIMLTLGIQK